MIDLVKLKLLAGDGGDGRISLHRSKYRPKGGPDGGDGGDGGNIIIRGNKNLNTLKSFAGVKEFSAPDGQDGGKNKQHGLKGKDIIIEVPLGTVVWLAAENDISQIRRKKYQRPAISFDLEETKEENSSQQSSREKETKKTSNAQQSSQEKNNNSPFRLHITLQRDEVEFEKYYQDWEGNLQSNKTVDEMKLIQASQEQEKIETKQFGQFDRILDSDLSEVVTLKLVEIKKDQQEVIVCQGGFGGRGNHAFRAATHQTPLEAEYGTYGEKKEVVLELRLLADLGLVGLPNAGKSTLLSRLTKALPKIADYPFTTLEPNLGVMRSKDGKKELVVADIPGLIEKASQGKGLGDRFLRHIENCQVLMYVLFLEEYFVYDTEKSLQEKVDMLWLQFQQLQKELGTHHKQLLSKPYIVSLNKIDIYPKELVQKTKERFEKEGETIIPFSGVTGEGLDEVRNAVFKV